MASATRVRNIVGQILFAENTYLCFACKNCDGEFLSLDSFDKHVNIVHKTNLASEDVRPVIYGKRVRVVVGSIAIDANGSTCLCCSSCDGEFLVKDSFFGHYHQMHGIPAIESIDLVTDDEGEVRIKIESHQSNTAAVSNVSRNGLATSSQSNTARANTAPEIASRSANAAPKIPMGMSSGIEQIQRRVKRRFTCDKYIEFEARLRSSQKRKKKTLKKTESK